MQKNSKLGRWFQAVCGVILVAFAATAAGVSGFFNYSLGEQIATGGGILFCLGDGAKIFIPVVAGVIGWSTKLKATRYLCIALSLGCAAVYLADNQGNLLANRASQAAAHADSRATISRLRAELAQITETGTPQSLELAAKLATDRVALETKAGGCRSRCIAAQTEAARLVERAGQARRRVELETLLARATAKSEATAGSRATGTAALLAPVIGTDAQTADRWKTFSFTVAGMLMLEVLSLLVSEGVETVAGAVKRSPPPKSQPKSQPKPAAKRGNVVSLKAEKIRKRDALIAELAAAGRTQREIAAQAGCSRTTVGAVLKRRSQPTKPTKVTGHF